jgi:uncharacterized repeat protein (TIGR01451 family)
VERVPTKLCVKFVLLSLFLATHARAVVVFTDDFNRSVTNQTVVSNNWIEVNTGLGDAAILTNQLVLKNGATAGRTYVAQSFTNFSAPFVATLNQNADQVVWNFNIRSARGGFNALTGFDYAQYGIAFVLAGSGSDFLSGTGYAVVWGQPGGVTPLRLVQFNSGLTNNAALSNLIVAANAPFDAVSTFYLSVRVIYDPATDAWELWARNDGTTGFADPSSGTLTFLGRATNSVYTGAALGFMGALWNYNTALNQWAYYDNFSVEAQLRPPAIAVQPQSQLVTLNGSGNLSVGAVGARPLSFQWFFNGSALGGQTNATLTLSNFQAANEGGYQVIVTNAYGSVTSAVAVLTVNRDYADAPDPTYPTYLTNNGARHVIVAGWFLGSTVDGETNGQPNVSATGDDLDVLRVACCVTNDDDGVVLTSRLVPGQSATLQVTASTNGYLNAWMDFNQNGSWGDSGEQVFVNQPLVAGVNNLSFNVPDLVGTRSTAPQDFSLELGTRWNASLPASGGGSVVGTNAYARFRFSSATGLPSTGEAPDGEVEDYQFAINSAADLAVSVTSTPEPVAVGSNVTYGIYVTNKGPSQASGVLITNVLPAGVSFVSATATRGSVTQNGVMELWSVGMLLAGAQATMTVVVAPSAAGTISDAASVTANEPDSNLANNSAGVSTTVLNRPVISGQPANLTVTNGNNASFTVTATGSGTLLYQWRFGGTNLVGTHSTASLTITNAQAANAGTYDVVVQDDVGYVVSAPATLTVLVPPGILGQPQSQTGNIGGFVTFSVTASGSAPLGYQWRFGPTNLNGQTSSTLTLSNLQTNNAGNYSVVVSNAAGTTNSAPAVLTVKAMDFGDAPDGNNGSNGNYGTYLTNNGARHVIVPGVYLGLGVSQDSDGKPNATATGDDLDDGVSFTNTLVAGQTGGAKVVASTNGYLSAWMDFSQDSSWAQGGDKIFDAEPLVKGTNFLSFGIPYFAQAGTTFARFRFTMATNGLSYDGIAVDGEVEDYQVTIAPATVTQLVMGSQPPAFATAGVVFDPPPTVYVADNLGQPVFNNSTSLVTAVRLAGAGTLVGTLSTASLNGVATFTNLYQLLATNITIKFTSGSLAVTSSVVEVDAAAASQLAFKTAPPASATAGALFSPQPVVQVLDAFGNLVSDDNGRLVTASRSAGLGTLQGTIGTQTTNGTAAFTNLSHLVANTITIDFASDPLTKVTSGSVAVSAATADRLAFTAQPGSATAGAAFGTQPVVKTQDAYGNNSTIGLGSSKSVTATLTSGAGPLQGTTNLDIGTGAGNGSVTFTNLRIDAAGTDKRLTASVSSGLSSGLSSVFTVSPAPFAKMQLLVPGETPAPGTTSGKTGTPSAQVTDAPFNVTVNAVDTNWNVISTVTDIVGITSSDANATLPANAALAGGTSTLPFTFYTAGSQTITVSNLTGLTGQTGRTNTSPAIAVTAAAYTAATGGSAISADLVGTLSTASLTGPIYQEASAGNVSTGTVALVCPSGFAFDTNTPLPTVKLEGLTGGNNHLINNAASGSNAPVSSVTSSQVVFTVLSASSSTTTKLTWQNLRVRPSAGTPLARSNLTETGTATMVGVRSNSNFGSLREIAGAAQRLTVVSQPSTINTAGVLFAQQPVAGVADQFGNLRSSANGNSDNGTLVTATVGTHSTASLSTLVGTLSTASLDGLAAFPNLSYNVAETITLKFTNVSLTSVTSAPVTVNPAAADRLAFSQQPASGVVGSNLATQPIVVSRDPYGNNSAVGLPLNLNLSLSLNQGTGPLLGTTNLDIGTSGGNGLAAFSNVRVDTTGTNKQLTASAVGPPPVGTLSTASQFFTVAKGDQTITFNPLANKTYGDSPFTVSATASSGLPVSFSLVSGPVSVSGNTVSITGAGSATVRAAQPGDTNYNAAPNVDRSFAIAQAALAVTADSKGRTYGATNPPLTGVLTGVQYSDNISAVYTTAATQSSPVGVYSIVPSLNDPNNKLPNYQLSTSNGFLTVSAAALSVTASNASRLYGQTNPVFTGSIVGLQNNDNISAVYTTAATQSSPAGTYPITPVLSDPDNKLPNYQLSTINGVLTVTNAPAAPRITDISVSDASLLTLSFTTVAGGSYRIEYKHSLTDPNWSVLTNVTGSGSVMSITDDTTGTDSRFYRVVLQ